MTKDELLNGIHDCIQDVAHLCAEHFRHDPKVKATGKLGDTVLLSSRGESFPELTAEQYEEKWNDAMDFLDEYERICGFPMSVKGMLDTLQDLPKGLQ